MLENQRIDDEGRMWTLASLPISMWVPTESSDIAHATLGAYIERQFGRMDWTDAPEGFLSTEDLIHLHKEAVEELLGD